MYYFIVNPNSRSGRGYKVWKKIEQQLINDSIEYQAYLTMEPGQAREFADELTHGCRASLVIVVVGGDGTMNEVLDGICFGGTITLGYIPAGSGNDLARSLKLPKSPRRCLKKILYPKYHKLLDYGVVTYGDDTLFHRRFMVSAGIGLDAAVCHNMLYSRGRIFMNRIGLGKLSYIMIGLRQLLKAKPAKGYILLDGSKKVEFNYIYFISAHIHPFEGNGFKFAPRADSSDGQLEVCVLNNSSKRKVLSVLFNALIGGHKKNKGIRTFGCREVSIHTERPMAVHVDGESCLHQKDIEVRCIEKKIRMIV